MRIYECIKDAEILEPDGTRRPHQVPLGDLVESSWPKNRMIGERYATWLARQLVEAGFLEPIWVHLEGRRPFLGYLTLSPQEPAVPADRDQPPPDRDQPPRDQDQPPHDRDQAAEPPPTPYTRPPGSRVGPDRQDRIERSETGPTNTRSPRSGAADGAVTPPAPPKRPTTSPGAEQMGKEPPTEKPSASDLTEEERNFKQQRYKECQRRRRHIKDHYLETKDHALPIAYCIQELDAVGERNEKGGRIVGYLYPNPMMREYARTGIKPGSVAPGAEPATSSPGPRPKATPAQAKAGEVQVDGEDERDLPYQGPPSDPEAAALWSLVQQELRQRMPSGSTFELYLLPLLCICAEKTLPGKWSLHLWAQSAQIKTTVEQNYRSFVVEAAKTVLGATSVFLSLYDQKLIVQRVGGSHAWRSDAAWHFFASKEHAERAVAEGWVEYEPLEPGETGLSTCVAPEAAPRVVPPDKVGSHIRDLAAEIRAEVGEAMEMAKPVMQVAEAMVLRGQELDPDVQALYEALAPVVAADAVIHQQSRNVIDESEVRRPVGGGVRPQHVMQQEVSHVS